MDISDIMETKVMTVDLGGTQSPGLKNLFTAMAKAQSQVGVALKGAYNPFFKSKYADLGAVWSACREALTTNGISVLQFPIHSEDGRLHLETMLCHSSGESISRTFSMPCKEQTAQGYASALTYLRRYALSATVGVVADEDDDGASNSELPLIRLIAQSQALHNLDTLRAVVSLKEALAEEEYSSAAMYLHHLGQEVVSALWIAPTKGGIFTTEEIARIKSNECAAKRTEYAMAQEAAKAK
jgi:hypothetical protein